MEDEGIDGTMYSHPIGDHGHAAGPLIGLADLNNEPVPLRGDVGESATVPTFQRVTESCSILLTNLYTEISTLEFTLG
jgi:hypothetical protein